MKLVEKKCPNCGAGLSFNETDSSVKCEYCKASFHVEKDKKKSQVLDSRHIDQAFNLVSDVANAAKPVVKTVAIVYVIVGIISVVITLVVFITAFGFISDSIKEQKNRSDTFNEIQKDFEADFDNIIDSQKPKLTELNQIDAKSLDIYKTESLKKLNSRSTSTGVKRVGNWERVGMYLLVPKEYGSVVLHDVYKATFQLKKKDYVLYAGIYYSGLELSDDGIVLDDYNGVSVIPMFRFTDTMTEFAHGYESVEEYYNKEIRGETGKYIIKASEGMYKENGSLSNSVGRQ